MTKIEPWMLDYFDDHDGQIVRWCKPCSTKDGVKRFVVIRQGQKDPSVDRFEKRHKYCNRDKEFVMKSIEAVIGRILTDKEKVFTQECMKEGFEEDRIVKFLIEGRQKMPSVSLMFQEKDAKSN